MFRGDGAADGSQLEPDWAVAPADCGSEGSQRGLSRCLIAPGNLTRRRPSPRALGEDVDVCCVLLQLLVRPNLVRQRDRWAGSRTSAHRRRGLRRRRVAGKPCGVTQERPPAQRRRPSPISQPGAPWSDRYSPPVALESRLRPGPQTRARAPPLRASPGRELIRRTAGPRRTVRPRD
jgi:hypothetical protein